MQSMLFLAYCKHCHFKNKTINFFKQLYWGIIQYLTIYPLKVYNSMAFNIVTKLCKHQHNQIRTFLLPHKKPHNPQLSIRNPLITLPPSPRQALIYFLSLDLPILDIWYKWNPTICSPFFWHNVIKIHSCFSTYQNFISLY